MKSKLVLSTLNKFSFSDIITIFDNAPKKALYEINLQQDVGEVLYYRKQILSTPNLKKIKAILSLEDVFLEEFNNNSMRDYIYEQLINYNYFRINNKIYSCKEGYIFPPLKTFFNHIDNFDCFSCKLITASSIDENYNTDFTIFSAEKDIIDIIPFKKLFRSNHFSSLA